MSEERREREHAHGRSERETEIKERARTEWVNEHSSRGSRVDLWGAAQYQAYDVAKQWFQARVVMPWHFQATGVCNIDGEGGMLMTAFAASAALGDVKMIRLFLDYCEEHVFDSIANGIKHAEGNHYRRHQSCGRRLFWDYCKEHDLNYIPNGIKPTEEHHVQVRGYATPLMAAVKGRSISAIRTLQKYCPNLDMDSLESFDSHGHGHIAAMSYAAEHGLKEIGELLWFEGASIDTVSDNGRTPWSLAYNNRHLDMCDWIRTKEGADCDNRREVEHKGDGPGKKWGPDMSRPVEKGDLFQAQVGNKTAMYYAAEHNLLELVKIMLSEGASVLPRSGKDGKMSEVDERGFLWAKADGYTPHDVASYKGFTTMDRLLYPIQQEEEEQARTGSGG